jgi:crotonobetaine/carnitine-CoA ligase
MNPHRPFVVEVGGRELTYGAFLEEALTWVSAFGALGVEAGDNVAMMYPTSINSALAWLAMAWRRARHVGVNTEFHGQSLEYVLTNSDAKALVVAERFLERIAPLGERLSKLSFVLVPDASGPVPSLPCRTLSGAEFLAGARPASAGDPPRRYDLAAIVYTSGTTGPSKGVMVPWGLMESSRLGMFDDLGEYDCFYSPYPMFHIAGMGTLATMGSVGGRCVLREKFDPLEFWAEVRRYGCTATVLIPAMANWLLRSEPQPDDADNPLDKVLMGPVIPEVGEFRRRFGVRVRGHFGMTETAGPISTADRDLRSADCGAGRLLPGYSVRLVDEHDEEVPDGEVGELIVRSDRPWMLNCGYYGMPERTAEAWRNGWFHTGDSFRQDAHGNFHFVDRKKDAIRRRGENISSFEVEAFVNRHPCVLESVAIGVPAAEPGEQELKVLAVPRPEATLTPEELFDHCAAVMPRFMVPRYIEIVGALPKTPATMRVQKAKLREQPFTGATWDRKAAGKELRK